MDDSKELRLWNKLLAQDIPSLENNLRYRLLASTPDIHPDSEMHSAVYQCVKYTVCEFWRQEFDSTYQHCKLKRNETLFRFHVKPEVELWRKVYRLLERLHALNYLWTLPHIVLELLVKEALQGKNGILCPFYRSGRCKGKAEHIKAVRAENSTLWYLENPFPEASPNSHAVIELAITLAEQFDEFRKQIYYPVVKARKTVTSYLAKRNTGIWTLEVTTGKTQRFSSRGKKAGN